MAGTRINAINHGNLSRKCSDRLIPKRGQVKLGIIVGIAHSVTSIFSHGSRK
uniref:Uncharacterized protein n=1 Tax=Cucumis sativus TaxID=3659 RepID=A0A0A0KLE0_CUCSA